MNLEFLRRSERLRSKERTNKSSYGVDRPKSCEEKTNLYARVFYVFPHSLSSFMEKTQNKLHDNRPRDFLRSFMFACFTLFFKPQFNVLFLLSFVIEKINQIDMKARTPIMIIFYHALSGMDLRWICLERAN